jgi:hypothetical protein
LEIQILAWDRHKNGAELNCLIARYSCTSNAAFLGVTLRQYCDISAIWKFSILKVWKFYINFKQFNSAPFLCLSQARIWISNAICCLFLCFFGLKWEAGFV